MSILHRERAFGKESRCEYLWCLHCERAYKYGEYREEVQLIPHDLRGKVMKKVTYQMCPYEDCDGSTVLDGIGWEEFRERHKDYPKIPALDKVYPLYPPEKRKGGRPKKNNI